jgi:hypothetical protein
MIKVKSAVQRIIEYKNEMEFEADGNTYVWTQYVGERGVVEYWTKNGVQVEGGDPDVEYQVDDFDATELFDNNHGIDCDHRYRNECARCGKVE